MPTVLVPDNLQNMQRKKVLIKNNIVPWLCETFSIFHWLAANWHRKVFVYNPIANMAGSIKHWRHRFPSCWNIVLKLDLAQVNFHNTCRKCLAMKLIQYTYKILIMSYYEVSFQSVRFLSKHGSACSFCFGVCYCFWPFALTKECPLHLRPCEKTVKPISHRVLPVSRKRNGESQNKFYIM